MSDEGSNKNKTVSFRVEEGKHEQLSDLDRGMSELYRGMTDLYLEDSFFREGVETLLDGEEETFRDYSVSQLEKHAEEFAQEVVDDFERPVDAAQLKEPLVNYALNAAAGYRTGTYEAVEDIREIDDSLGKGIERATDRFPKQYWDEALE
jgi:hypothetical protein